MALVHPDKVARVRSSGEVHPALGLLAGFALLSVVAVLVHLVFGLL